MKKAFFFSVLLASLALTSGCLKENCDCEMKTYPPVFFQYEYVNYAWGYRHHGFLIDHAGNIRGFKEPDQWNFPDSAGFITKEALELNLAQCDTIYGKVGNLELTANYRSLDEILTGKIEDYGIVMADAGTGVLSGWSWNEKAGKYQSVFLISNGDLSRENTHESVKPLVKWLHRIGEKTDRFFWFDGN